MEAQRTQVLKPASFWGTKQNKQERDKYLCMKALLMLLGFK